MNGPDRGDNRRIYATTTTTTNNNSNNINNNNNNNNNNLLYASLIEIFNSILQHAVILCSLQILNIIFTAL